MPNQPPKTHASRYYDEPSPTWCGLTVTPNTQLVHDRLDATCLTCNPKLFHARTQYQYTLEGRLEHIRSLPHVASAEITQPAPNQPNFNRWNRTTVYVLFNRPMPSSCAPNSPKTVEGVTLGLWSINNRRTFRFGDDDVHKFTYGHAIPRFFDGTRMTRWSEEQHHGNTNS